MRRQQLAFTRANAAAQAVFHVGAAAALGVAVWLAVGRAGLGAPELLAMALIAVRVLPGLLRLQQEAQQQLAYALPAWQHALEMERVLRDAAEPPAAPGAGPLPLRRELTVDGVSFRDHDPRGGRPVLADVDLVIPAGRSSPSPGRPVRGKSTLADLLLGLLERDAGQVRVDGAPLRGAARRRWRRSVAYAPQDPYRFHGTIRSNLLRARPGATEAALWAALRMAAAEFAGDLPDGLETGVGDRGARLSGGERQRIVLARALLREPALLILDEATSQLDADAERRVLAALRSLRGRVTIVAVTHRPAVLAAADHAILLKAGRVAATGTRRELAPIVSRSSPTFTE